MTRLPNPHRTQQPGFQGPELPKRRWRYLSKIIFFVSVKLPAVIL